MQSESLPQSAVSKPHVPKLKQAYTDRDKNTFLRVSFDEIVSTIESFAEDTCETYSHFEHEIEKITSRKVLFTLYNDGQELTSFKIWLGDGFGSNVICLLHGKGININDDNSTNEIINLEEYEGELKLKPMGMAMSSAQRGNPLSPQEVAEYIWQVVCRQFSH